MLKRSLIAATLAALVSVGFPTASHAEVSSAPAAGYPTFNGTVEVITHHRNTVYVGGRFTRISGKNGTFVRRGAAAFNVNNGRVKNWNPNVRGEVKDIAAGSDGVYLVGEFNRVKKKPHRNIAKVTRGGKGLLVKGFRHGANGPVNTVLVAGNKVWVGGDFSRFGGSERFRLAGFKRVGKHKLNGWAPEARNGEVMDLVRTGRGIYVAGEFRSFEGRVGYQRLALVRPGNGRLVEGFDPRNRRIVHDIHAAGGRLYAAEGGPNGGGVMALDASTGEDLWERRLDGDAEAVTLIGSDVYVGGHFDNVCDDDGQVSDGDCTAGQTPRLRGASFDLAGELTGWDPQGNTEIGVRSFDVHAGRLLVGGGFTAPTTRFALFR